MLTDFAQALSRCRRSRHATDGVGRKKQLPQTFAGQHGRHVVGSLIDFHQPPYRNLLQLNCVYPCYEIEGKIVMAVKHRCFVSYHKVNSTAVKNFVEEFSDVFTAKTVGVTDEDDFINSNDREYVMRRIREKYLSNTTVTIVLIGECTKARKYVDWEIASSLRNDPVNGRSGLLGINMKSVGSQGLAPLRLGDNYDSEDKAGSYALYQTYPNTEQVLRNAIQTAFDRRETHTPINTRDLFKNNRPCP